MFTQRDPLQTRNPDSAAFSNFKPQMASHASARVESKNRGENLAISEGAQIGRPTLVNSHRAAVFSDILMIEPLSTVQER